MTDTDRITSPANPRVKAASRLRDATERRHRGLTLIDGVREIERAAIAGVIFEEIFVDSSRPPDAELLERLVVAGGRVVELAPSAFERIAFGSRNEGVVAVARMGDAPLERFHPGPGPLLVLEGVEKPGNLGAVLRTADATACGGVLVVDGGTDPSNPQVIRASLGTVFSVPLAAADAGQAVRWLVAAGRRTVAAVPGVARQWHAADLRGSIAILLGSESEGISSQWREAAAAGSLQMELVSLPMLGVADSLNVSAAAAVLAYESLRQTGCHDA